MAFGQLLQETQKQTLPWTPLWFLCVLTWDLGTSEEGRSLSFPADTKWGFRGARGGVVGAGAASRTLTPVSGEDCDRLLKPLSFGFPICKRGRLFPPSRAQVQ